MFELVPKEEEILDVEKLTGRTEEQIIYNDPLLLFFGGKAYEFHKPSLKRSRAWKKNLIDFQKSLQEAGQNAIKSDTSAMSSLEFLAVESIDRMADLVFEYCDSPGSSVTRELLEQSTEEEIAAAYGAVCKAAFPLDMRTAGAALFVKALTHGSP